MRIGIDAHAAERDGSGNCTYIRGLIRGLLELERENDYVLYVIDKEHRFYRDIRDQAGVRLHPLRIKSPLLRIPVFLAAATYGDDLDVLHVQYIAPPRHSGSLVVTIHDTAFLHVPRTFARLEALRSRLLVPRTARRAERIITGSESSKTDIAADCRVEPGKIDVTPYGVSASFAETRDAGKNRDVPAKYGIREPYILCVGRLNARKNLTVLVVTHNEKMSQEMGRQLHLIEGKLSP